MNNIPQTGDGFNTSLRASSGVVGLPDTPDGARFVVDGVSMLPLCPPGHVVCRYCGESTKLPVQWLTSFANVCQRCSDASGASYCDTTATAINALSLYNPFDRYSQRRVRSRFNLDTGVSFFARTIPTTGEISARLIESRQNALQTGILATFLAGDVPPVLADYAHDADTVFSPRSSNTGGENKNEKSILDSEYADKRGLPVASDYKGVLPVSDWLQGTFHPLMEGDAVNAEEIMRFLSLTPSLYRAGSEQLPHWEKLPSGRNNYKSGYKRGGIILYCDGQTVVQTKEGNTVEKDMGVHVSISSTGLRELEGLGIIVDPVDFIDELLTFGFKFSRLDFAMDDFSGNVTFEKIESALRAGDFVCRSKRKKMPNGSMLERIVYMETQGGGKSVSIGNRESESFVRGYQKGFEQLQKMDIVPSEEDLELLSRWFRFEGEFKGDRAHQLAQKIVEEGMTAAVGAIRAFIDFKEHGNHDNKSMWEPAKWWDDFCGSVEKVKFVAQPKPIMTIERTKRYLMRQAACGIALLVAAGGYGIAALSEIVEAGAKRWTPAHISALFNTQWDYPYTHKIDAMPRGIHEQLNPNKTNRGEGS